MHIEFLVEDLSGSILIAQVMKKYNEENNMLITYHVKPYKGIGRLMKGPDAKDVKAEQLLSELPKRLRAIQIQTLYREDVSVFVVIDNDKRDTDLFYKQLTDVAMKYDITMDHVFCIAVEEMEAWLLGDIEAIRKAYPRSADRVLSKHHTYIQDSICNTWEFLADILTPEGIKGFKAKNKSAYEIGKKKCEWAERIGSEMNLRGNRSPSFKSFLDELDRRSERYLAHMTEI